MGRATRWIKGLLGMKTSSSEKHGEPERCRFGVRTDGLCGNPETIPPNISASEAAWLRSYCEAALAETEKELSRRATANETAAAAYAAVAAAKAAAVVVQLTGGGGREVFGCGRQKWRSAALKIQCVFRSYLARKALRALRGVVKIQALVRGYLVRKQAAATLRSMQAIVRAQSAAKLQRARKSMERFEEETISTHSRRFSGSFLTGIKNSNEETAAKIVEIDTGDNRFGPSRIRKPDPSSGSDLTEDIYQYRSFSSPLSGRVPTRINIPKPDFDEYLTSKKFPTAQSTPRRIVPSPSRSVSGAGGGGFFQECNPKNYMADTTSFRAKLRAHSAPRQRPEMVSGRTRRRTGDVAAADEWWRRSVNGGVRTRSPSGWGAGEGMSFRDAVVGKLV